MIHVILDTNIYRHSPQMNSPEFKSFLYLLEKKHITLHIPYFIENEFTSFQNINGKEHVDKIVRSLSKLLGYENYGVASDKIEEIITNVKDNSDSFLQEKSASFINLLNDYGANRYTLELDSTEKAITAYFEGLPPLKSPKIRDHIPDSFIFQEIKKLHETYGDDLHLVIHDNNLRESCEKLKIKSVSTLDEFIKLENISPFLIEKIIEENFVVVTDHVENYLNNNKEEIIKKTEDMLLKDEFRLLNGDGIPGELNEIYVSGVNEPHELEYDFPVEYYGNGVFVMYFNAAVELMYEYAVFRSDAYELDRNKFYIEDVNEHYVNVETTDSFNFKGYVEIKYEKIDSENRLDGLLGSLDNPVLTIGGIDEFDIVEND